MAINDYFSAVEIPSTAVMLLAHFTAWLVIAMLARIIWSKFPARAHRAMVVTTVAAVLSPCVACFIQISNWGLLPVPAHTAVDSSRSIQLTQGIHSAGDRYTHGKSPVAPESEAMVLDKQTTSPGPLVIPEPDRESKTAARVSLHGVSTIFFVAWSSISGLLLLRLLWSFVVCRRVVEDSSECSQAQIQAGLGDAIACLRVAAPPRLLTSTRIGTPLIWCWPKTPALLIPRHLATQDLGRQAWRMVCCHELAHYLRRDHWASLWADLLVILVPWHPLNWYVRRELRVLQELACDDFVLHGRQDQVTYAETLLAAASPSGCEAALAMARRGRHLRRRIDRVLSAGGASPIVDRGWLTAFVLIVSLGVAAAALAQVPADPSSRSTITSDGNGGREAASGGMESEIAFAKQALKTWSTETIDPQSSYWRRTLQDFALERALARNRISTSDDPVAARYLREIRSALDAAHAERIAIRAADSGLSRVWLGRLYAEVTRIHAREESARGTITWAQASLRNPISAYERADMLGCWSTAANRLNRRDAQEAGRYVVKLPAFLRAIEIARMPQEFPQTTTSSLDRRDPKNDSIALAEWYSERFLRVAGWYSDWDPLLVPMSERRSAVLSASVQQSYREVIEAMQVKDLAWQNSETQSWLLDRYAFAQTLPLNATRIQPNVANLIDALAAQEGFAQDWLASLRDDPKGPRIDLMADVIAHLSDEMSVVVHYANPSILQGEALLVVVPLTAADPIEQALGQIAAAAPQQTFELQNKDRTRGVNCPISDDQHVAIALHDGQLLIATGEWLLQDAVVQMVSSQ